MHDARGNGGLRVENWAHLAGRLPHQSSPENEVEIGLPPDHTQAVSHHKHYLPHCVDRFRRRRKSCLPHYIHIFSPTIHGLKHYIFSAPHTHTHIRWRLYFLFHTVTFRRRNLAVHFGCTCFRLASNMSCTSNAGMMSMLKCSNSCSCCA